MMITKYVRIVVNDTLFFTTMFLLHFRNHEIIGKNVTPFILQRVNEITKGKSLEASILFNKCCVLMSTVISGMPALF